jgi:hypothetical protein
MKTASEPQKTGIYKESCCIVDLTASFILKPIWLLIKKRKNIKSIGLINNDITYMVCEHLNRLQYLSIHLLGLRTNRNMHVDQATTPIELVHHDTMFMIS